MDVVKTRLQTQPERYPDGPLAALRDIVREEGPGALAQVGWEWTMPGRAEAGLRQGPISQG